MRIPVCSRLPSRETATLVRRLRDAPAHDHLRLPRDAPGGTRTSEGIELGDFGGAVGRGAVRRGRAGGEDAFAGIRLATGPDLPGGRTTRVPFAARGDWRARARAANTTVPFQPPLRPAAPTKARTALGSRIASCWGGAAGGDSQARPCPAGDPEGARAGPARDARRRAPAARRRRDRHPARGHLLRLVPDRPPRCDPGFDRPAHGPFGGVDRPDLPRALRGFAHSRQAVHSLLQPLARARDASRARGPPRRPAGRVPLHRRRPLLRGRQPRLRAPLITGRARGA